MANIQEKFTELTKKKDDLANRAMRVNVTIEEAKKRHLALLATAKEKYNVESVDELRNKLAIMHKENEETVANFQAALEVSERKIIEAEAVIANLSSPAANGARN